MTETLNASETDDTAQRRAVTSPILVTGGTGVLGSHIVRRLRSAGYGVRVLSRHARERADGLEFVAADLSTDAGVAAAVAGSEVIVHCAGSNKGDEGKTLHLVRAASEAGARHIVYISVVGAERVPVTSGIDRAMFGYFASKRAAEKVIEQSGVPWTTLRATQFHDLILLVAQQMAKLPIIPVPIGMRFQPVDSDEVAARMFELALGAPAGLVPDIAGPRVYTMAELLRSYLRTRRMRRLFVPIPLPGGSARAVRAGANLSVGGTPGRRTWEEFLAERSNAT